MTSSLKCNPGLLHCDEESKLHALDKVQDLEIQCNVEDMDNAFLMASGLTD